MAIPSIDNFLFGEQLASADLNAMLADSASLAAGTGISSGAITEAKLASALTPMVQLATSSPNGANVSFTSISASYKHLLVKCLILGTNAGSQALNMNFNNDGGGNYDTEIVAWNNATATGSGGGGGTAIQAGTVPASGNTPRFYSFDIEIPHYTSAVAYKTMRSHGSRSEGTAAGNQFNEYRSAFWRSTAVINRVDFAPGTGNFGNGSKFYLYGYN